MQHVAQADGVARAGEAQVEVARGVAFVDLKRDIARRSQRDPDGDGARLGAARDRAGEDQGQCVDAVGERYPGHRRALHQSGMAAAPARAPCTRSRDALHTVG